MTSPLQFVIQSYRAWRTRRQAEARERLDLQMRQFRAQVFAETLEPGVIDTAAPDASIGAVARHRTARQDEQDERDGWTVFDPTIRLQRAERAALPWLATARQREQHAALRFDYEEAQRHQALLDAANRPSAGVGELDRW